MQLRCYEIYRHLNGKLIQSRNKLQISVMFSVLFEKRQSHQVSTYYEIENTVWIQHARVGNDVENVSILIAIM